MAEVDPEGSMAAAAGLLRKLEASALVSKNELEAVRRDLVAQLKDEAKKTAGALDVMKVGSAKVLVPTSPNLRKINLLTERLREKTSAFRLQWLDKNAVKKLKVDGAMEGLKVGNFVRHSHRLARHAREFLGQIAELEPDLEEEVQQTLIELEDNKLDLIKLETKSWTRLTETLLRGVNGRIKRGEVVKQIDAFDINRDLWNLSLLEHPKASVQGMLANSSERMAERVTKTVSQVPKRAHVMVGIPPVAQEKMTPESRTANLAWRLFSNEELDKKYESLPTAKVPSSWRGLGLSYNTPEWYVPVPSALVQGVKELADEKRQEVLNQAVIKAAQSKAEAEAKKIADTAKRLTKAAEAAEKAAAAELKKKVEERARAAKEAAELAAKKAAAEAIEKAKAEKLAAEALAKKKAEEEAAAKRAADLAAKKKAEEEKKRRELAEAKAKAEAEAKAAAKAAAESAARAAKEAEVKAKAAAALQAKKDAELLASAKKAAEEAAAKKAAQEAAMKKLDEEIKAKKEAAAAAAKAKAEAEKKAAEEKKKAEAVAAEALKKKAAEEAAAKAASAAAKAAAEKEAGEKLAKAFVEKEAAAAKAAAADLAANEALREQVAHAALKWQATPLGPAKSEAMVQYLDLLGMLHADEKSLKLALTAQVHGSSLAADAVDKLMQQAWAVAKKWDAAAPGTPEGVALYAEVKKFAAQLNVIEAAQGKPATTAWKLANSVPHDFVDPAAAVAKKASVKKGAAALTGEEKAAAVLKGQVTKAKNKAIKAQLAYQEAITSGASLVVEGQKATAMHEAIEALNDLEDKAGLAKLSTPSSLKGEKVKKSYYKAKGAKAKAKAVDAKNTKERFKAAEVLPASVDNRGPETVRSWVNQNYPKQESLISGLSAAEEKAVASYKGHHYSELNRAFRDAKGDLAKAVLAEKQKATAAGLDALFARSALDKDTVVFRGVGGSGWVDALVPGATWTEHAYMSTSMSKRSAFGGKVRFEILLPKGSKGIYADGVAGGHVPNNGEREILLPRGSSFKVLGVKVEKGKYDYADKKVIYMEMLK